MKKAGWGLALLFALTTMGTGIAAAKDQTFSGEIMDSSCADMGSHAMMLKGHGMAGKENDPAAKKMCTLDCVKAGAKSSFSMRNRRRCINWMIRQSQSISAEKTSRLWELLIRPRKPFTSPR